MIFTPLQKEVLRLSYENKLSHLTSTLSAVEIIARIYREKGPYDRFVLSQGHAALALYVVLGRGQALLNKYGYHPHRSPADGIYCSTGSLGQGITVALGMAMAGRTTHCLISDGEAAEGSVWEVLRHADNFPHLHIYLNFNGQSAFGLVHTNLISALKGLHNGIAVFRQREPWPIPALNGVRGHYHILTKEEYETAIR